MAFDATAACDAAPAIDPSLVTVSPRAWDVRQCLASLAPDREAVLCDAFRAGGRNGTFSLLMVGDSTVANLFLALVAVLLPVGPHDTTISPASIESIESTCYGERHGWRSFLQSNASLKTLRLDQEARGLCTFASRCNGALEVHYWTLPNPMDGVSEAVARSLTGASGRRLSLHRDRRDEDDDNENNPPPPAPPVLSSSRFDGVILGMGAHYMPQAHRLPTDASFSSLRTDAMRVARWRHDLHTIASALEATMRPQPARPMGTLGQQLLPRVAFLTMMRPNPAKQSRDVTEQTACAAQRLNAVAAQIMHSSGFGVVDSFPFSKGAEAHARDSVHYDRPVLLPLVAAVIESIVGADLDARALRRATAATEALSIQAQLRNGSSPTCWCGSNPSRWCS